MSGYTEPNALVRREQFGGETTAGATTESCKFRSFQKMKLKNVHAVVTVAGTATTHKLDVFRGTTSVASISLGTSAIGATAKADSSGPGLDLAYAALEQLSVKTGADATGRAQVVYEFEVDHDAVRTK
jgi:hypothetical protein